MRGWRECCLEDSKYLPPPINDARQGQLRKYNYANVNAPRLSPVHARLLALPFIDWLREAAPCAHSFLLSNQVNAEKLI
jgi:hypothetical protein